ncbi:hypothetical protein GW17_00048040 [Ensete ventricosum]|nr:hypothetical protein GW17_00048040 [Ensete ventricosum]
MLSSDSTDSLRVQLRHVNKWLDEVQKEVTKSKEEASESFKRGSPFAPKIQDNPIPTSFRLPALESYDGSSDPSEHAYTRAVVEKRPRCCPDPEISFRLEGEEYPDYDDALVVTVRIANAQVKRIMIDTGRWWNLLYDSCLFELPCLLIHDCLDR